MPVSSPDLNALMVTTPFCGDLSDASLDLPLSMMVERRFDGADNLIAELANASRKSNSLPLSASLS